LSIIEDFDEKRHLSEIDKIKKKLQMQEMDKIWGVRESRNMPPEFTGL